MNINKELKTAFDVLAKANIESARSDAYLLLSFAVSREKSFIYAHPEYELSRAESELFSLYINRRALSEPVAYITGSKEFYGIDFIVDKNVLIPRPDTELVVDEVLKYVKKAEDVSLNMLDLCCGSGCIGISILKNAPSVVATFADISDKAVDICKENVLRHKIAARAEIIKSDMFLNLENRKFDIIVSNPPYVTIDEYASLSEDITHYEPIKAFIAGSDGLNFYRIIAKQSKDHLNDGGFIALEIGCTQAQSVSALLSENGFENIKVYKDLAGLDRVVSAERKA